MHHKVYVLGILRVLSFEGGPVYLYEYMSSSFVTIRSTSRYWIFMGLHTRGGKRGHQEMGGEGGLRDIHPGWIYTFTRISPISEEKGRH